MKPVTISSYFDILSQSQKAYGRQLEPICQKWVLTRSELDVLLFLYNNPQYNRAADIVTHRGMTKSHVSMSVASLADRGLLERSVSEADRRIAHLILTRQAIPIAAEARAAQQQFFQLLYEGITHEELMVWERISRQVFENIRNIND